MQTTINLHHVVTEHAKMRYFSARQIVGYVSRNVIALMFGSKLNYRIKRTINT